MMRLRLEDIRKVAAIRPEGYLERVMAVGTVVGDWLEIEEGVFGELRETFSQSEPCCQPEEAMATEAVVQARVAVCAACDDLEPGTCRCSRYGCVATVRRAAAPICCWWPA